MAGAEQAGKQRQADDHIEPLLDDLAVHPGQLDQQVGQQGGHDQLPDAFHPDVHDPPPIKFVQRQVGRIVEGEQPEYRRQPKTQHEDGVDRRLATFPEGHAGVVEEHQEGDGDQDLRPQRLLQELAPLVDTELVTDQGARTGHRKNGQLHIRDHRAVNLGFGLLWQEEVGAAHEAHQQPDDQQVGVAHAHDVEGHHIHQEFGQHVDHCGQNAEGHLEGKQGHGQGKKGQGNPLRRIFHRLFSCLSGAQPARYPTGWGGQFWVLMLSAQRKKSTS